MADRTTRVVIEAVPKEASVAQPRKSDELPRRNGRRR